MGGFLKSISRFSYALLITSLICPSTWATAQETHHSPVQATTQQRLFGEPSTVNSHKPQIIPLGMIEEESPCAEPILDAAELDTATLATTDTNMADDALAGVAKGVTHAIGSMAVIAYRVTFELPSTLTATASALHELNQDPLRPLTCMANNTLNMVAEGVQQGQVDKITEGVTNLFMVAAAMEGGAALGSRAAQALSESIAPHGAIGLQVSGYLTQAVGRLGLGVATLEPVVVLPASVVTTTAATASQAIAAATSGVVMMRRRPQDFGKSGASRRPPLNQKKVEPEDAWLSGTDLIWIFTVFLIQAGVVMCAVTPNRK